MHAPPQFGFYRKGYGVQSCPLATPVVSYVYDSGDNAIGHLTSLTDQAGTASYTYDILGRLTAETRTLTGPTTLRFPRTSATHTISTVHSRA